MGRPKPTKPYYPRPSSRKPEYWWTHNGYIAGNVWVDGKKIRVRQYRWIMENALGRKLKRNEHVHHINGIKSDNRLENLQVMTATDHCRMTRLAMPSNKGRKLKISAEGRAKRAKNLNDWRARKKAERV